MYHSCIKPHASLLSEILCRYWLVAHEDQDDALFQVLIGARESDGIWKERPVDLEGCRTVLRTYSTSKWLLLANLALHPSPPIEGLFILLEFVVSFIRPGVEDLLPSLVGFTICCIQDWSTSVPQNCGLELDAINQMFLEFG